MYYSHLADINVGITATIWFCCPIWTAIFDYYING
jgi:drug/metabolite transporter (DMT)-like permease